jgi:hypothetical protein
MRAITKFLAGGVAIAALASAAPAAAQYYPGYGYPGSGYGYGYPGYGNGGVIGSIINGVMGGGYGGYGLNSQAVVNQCANAVQARLSGGGYGGYGYGYGQPGAYGGGRVLGISRVEQRSSGGLTVRGVATTGRYAGYGYTVNSPVDLVWKCRTDYRGLIVDVDIDPAQSNYGYNNNYTPWNYDYSQYGYRRY